MKTSLKISRFAVPALALSLGFSVVGCKKTADDESGQSRASESEQSEGSAAEEASTDQQILMKISPFIQQCWNRHNPRVQADISSYFEWAGDGDTLASTNPRDVNSVNEPIWAEECIEAIDETRNASPKLDDLDAALAEFKAAAEALNEARAQAYTYYDREDYKDDSFAKAQEMHPGLVTAFKNYASTYQTAAGMVDALDEEVTERRLQALKDDPNQQLEYRLQNFMYLAENAVDLAAEATLDESGTMQHPNVEALREAVEKVKTAQDDLSTYIKSDEGPETEEQRDDADDVSDDAEDFRQSVVEMVRGLDEGRKHSGIQARWFYDVSITAPDGSPGEALQTYNDLVDEYNRR